MAPRLMVLRIVATLAASSLIAACGYKGPLYMPQEPNQPRSEQPAPPPPTPVTSLP